MGAASSQINKWDDLFQALTRPEDLKTYLRQNVGTQEGNRQGTLGTQIELLVGTLQVDVALLKVTEVAESFDTATFCLGQLVSHEPQLMSELPFAHMVVEGLSCALAKGWHVHHGVAKFAANALTILCICEAAAPSIRQFAIDEIVQGLAAWLRATDEAQELDEVCGCNCGCAALSATCWLERLLGKTDPLLEDKLRSHPKLRSLCVDLLNVVSRRDGNPFALTRLLCVPGLFKHLLRTQPLFASEALCFLAFGLAQFDNPMFTEDAVQALLVLLRDQSGSAVLAHRASLPLLEALSTASCYLPSAMSALELLAASPGGRTVLYSLAAALSADRIPTEGEAEPAAIAELMSAPSPAQGQAPTPAPAPAQVQAEGRAQEPLQEQTQDEEQEPVQEQTRAEGRTPPPARSQAAALPATSTPVLAAAAAEAPSHGASSSLLEPSTLPLEARGQSQAAAPGPADSSSTYRQPSTRGSPRGGASSGTLVRLLFEAAAKLRNAWLTAPRRLSTRGGASRAGAGMDGDAAFEAAGASLHPGGPTVDAASGTLEVEPAPAAADDETDADEANSSASDDGEALAAPREATLLPDLEQEHLVGVDAWDRFVADLPTVSAAALANVETAESDAKAWDFKLDEFSTTEDELLYRALNSSVGSSPVPMTGLVARLAERVNTPPIKPQSPTKHAFRSEHLSVMSDDTPHTRREDEDGDRLISEGGDEISGVPACTPEMDHAPSSETAGPGAVGAISSNSTANGTASMQPDGASAAVASPAEIVLDSADLADTVPSITKADSSAAASSPIATGAAAEGCATDAQATAAGDVGSSDGAGASSLEPSSTRQVPEWPNPSVKPDVVKAWVLLEMTGFMPGQEAELLSRMTLSHKRIWLSRRLYREHHGGRLSEEEPLLFVECTRDDAKGAVLDELRSQFETGVGLGSDLAGTLEVHFKDENSAGSAVRREWFSLVSDAFLSSEAGLLVSTDRGIHFRPAEIAPKDEATNVLRDLEILGRFLGLALLQHVTVNVRLHPQVCKLLLNKNELWEWTDDDVRTLDEVFFKNKVQYLRENDVEPLCLTFTDVLHDRDPGSGSGVVHAEVELVPNGAGVAVTEANKHEYIHLVCEWRLFGSISRQVEAMLRGLHAAVPVHIIRELAQLIEPADLACMLAGEAEIDVADWQRNSLTAGGLQRSGRVFRWFWKAVRSFDPEERALLLQFVTGSQRPPVGGFAQLQGFNGGVHKFTLCAGHEPRDSLPRAHACICTIDLPEYSSYSALRRSVHTALSLGSVGFDDAAVAADGGNIAGEADDDHPDAF